MSSITIKNLSVEFVKYHDHLPSLKDSVLSFFSDQGNGKKEVKKALSNINLHVKEGDRLGIVGFNGAGKSTLLKSIAGIYAPSRGEIVIEGSLVPILELGVGFDHSLTVAQNIELSAAVMGLDKKQIKSVYDEILHFSELEELQHQPLHTLSSGMSSKLSFSIATCLSPDILLLDEVFAAGDAAFVDKARKKIESMIASSKVLLFTSHQESLVCEICNKAILINDGRIIASGSTAEVYESYHALYS